MRCVRGTDTRTLLSAGSRQTVARRLSQVFAMSSVARLTTHLLREGRSHLLQGGLLQVRWANRTLRHIDIHVW